MKELFYQIKLGGSDVVLTRAEDIKLALTEINKQLKVTDDNDAYDKLKEQQLKLLAAQKDVRKEQNLLIKEFRGTSAGIDSYRDLEARLEKAREAYRNLTGEQRKNSVVAEELRQDIKELNTELKSIDKDLGLSFRSIGDYQGGILDALDRVIPGLSGLRGELEGIGELGGFDKLLGLGFGAFAAVEVIGQATAEVQEFVVELNDLRREVNAITRETGEGLDEITVRSAALAAGFNADSNEIVRAANSVAKNFEIGFGETFDFLEAGFARGLDKGGEFLDGVREYAPQFADARLSAGELFSVLELQLTQGIYSDKGVDAIKEAAISLRELNGTTIDALDQIGISAEEVRAAIEEDGLGGAISLVSNRLQDFRDDSTEVGVVLADVFRGAGEDAGIDFVKSLGNIQDGYAELDEETARYVENQQRVIESNKDLIEVQNQVAKRFDESSIGFEVAGNKLQEFFVRVLLRIIEIFEPVVDGFRQVFNAIGDLGRQLGIIGGDFDFMEAAVRVVTNGINVFAVALRFVATQVNNVVESVRSYIDSSPALQVAIRRGVELWNQTREAIGLIPAVVAGVREAVAQGVENMKANIEDFYLSARIRFEQLRSLNPFGDAAEQAEETITRLTARRQEIEDSGRTIGEAYAEGFKKAVEAAAVDVVDPVGGGSNDDGAGLLGGSSADEEARLEKERERIEKLRELRRNAADDEARFEIEKQELLRSLAAKVIDEEIKLMEDGIEKEKAIIRDRFDDRLVEIGKIESDFLRKVAETEAKLVEAFGEGSAELLNFREKSAEGLIEVQNQVGELEANARRQKNKELLAIDEEFALEASKQRLEDLKRRIFDADRVGEEEIRKLRERLADQQITEEAFREESYQIAKLQLEEQASLLNEELEAVNLKVEADIPGAQEEFNKLKSLKAETDEELIKLEEDRAKAVDEIRKMEAELWKEDLSKILGFVSQGLDIFGDFFDSLSERRVAKLDEETEKREETIDALKEQLDEADGIQAESLRARIRQEEKGLEEINKKRAEAERKDAIREKGIAITKSIINTALAITKVLPNLILASVIGGFGALQTAAIAAQPLADGGKVGATGESAIVSVSGELIGDRGLVVAKSAKGDDRLIYARADEAVINQEQINLLGGAAMMRAVGIKGFADGGAIVPRSPSLNPSSGGGGVLGMIDALNKKTDAINSRFDRMKVFIVDEELSENESDKNFIKVTTELE